MVFLSTLGLKDYSDLSLQLQNVLTTFPVLLATFEIFTKPEFMLLFSTEFLLQLMNAWLHAVKLHSTSIEHNRNYYHGLGGNGLIGVTILKCSFTARSRTLLCHQ